MRRKVLIVFGLLVLLSGLLAGMPATAAGPNDASHMPPNEELIVKALRARGAIPQDATEEQVQAIYQGYIKQKLTRGEDRPNPLGAAQIQRGEATGKPENHHGRVMRPNNKRFDNVLTLLVEFTGTEGGMTGPLHNEMAQPGDDDNTTYWVPDFGREHYNNLLFDMKPGARSMANYYLEQSGGLYTVDGQVYGWVRVPHSEWYYGADGSTDTDNLNGPVWRVVQDAVIAAGNTIPWA